MSRRKVMCRKCMAKFTTNSSNRKQCEKCEPKATHVATPNVKALPQNGGYFSGMSSFLQPLGKVIKENATVMLEGDDARQVLRL